MFSSILHSEKKEETTEMNKFYKPGMQGRQIGVPGSSSLPTKTGDVVDSGMGPAKILKVLMTGILRGAPQDFWPEFDPLVDGALPCMQGYVDMVDCKVFIPDLTS